MKRHNYKFSILNSQFSILLIAFFFSLPIKAQVNIGSLDNPQSFSILELTAKQKNGGLRLPQLTTGERDDVAKQWTALDPESEIAKAAQGLVIYNKTTDCLEFWNGNEWISMCADILDCSKFSALEGSSYSFCSDENATVATLTAKAGGNVQWRLSPGGAMLTNTTLLTSATYYAYRNIPSCNISDNGVPVTVKLVNCSAITANNGRITTFTNVMYDFQRQTLEAYVTAGGEPTGWQWQVGTSRTGTYVDIPGETSATYTVPANFIHNYDAASLVNDELFFKCVLSNSATPSAVITDANALGIEFIRTTDEHGNFVGKYGIDANGVRYLTINRGGSLNDGKINIALLNLGQSGTGAYMSGVPLNNDNGELNDAGDLGDFYQWGRIADEHEHTVWSKDPSTRVNQIIPMDGNGATSLPVARNADMSVMGVVDADGGQAKAYGFAGNFIGSIDSDWGSATTASNSRWGDGTNVRPGTAWTFGHDNPQGNDNNPCPSGWRVPSHFELWDIYNGNGSNSPGNSVGYGTFANGNTWRWRPGDSPSGTQAIGGVIITNPSGEKVFLPAAGSRNDSSGALEYIGTIGYYYSSSSGNLTINARELGFNSTLVQAGFISNLTRTTGKSVRCVSE